MHFSIPDAHQATDENGSSFWYFHIHVNGVYHCKQRYSQLDKFYEKLMNTYPDSMPSKLFPPKKLFSLSTDQLEERREQLEKFIQFISQDPILGVSDEFNNFLLQAQQDDYDMEPTEVAVEIFLMNGNKVSVNVMTNDKNDRVYEAAMNKIGLKEDFFYYFALFMVEKVDNDEIRIVRKLQDFESPYLSLKAVEQKPHRIVIRKNYWNSKYDEDLINDRVAMNLLYVQTVDDLDRGWVLCTNEQKSKLNDLQERNLRKEFLQMTSKLKFYGYTHYLPCKANYPKDNSTVLMASGNREFNIRVKTEDKKVMEGSFVIQKIRSWRLSSTPDSEKKENLQFSFEYLFKKGDIRWINVESTQAVMMSMVMQGIVDEILREQSGKGIRKKGEEDTESSIGSSDAVKKAVNHSEEKTNKTLKKKNNLKKNEVFASHDIGDDDL
ncbi:sorting nexin-17 isoform X2 [Hydra vulgaris]|uniref:Sorting nexin-17 isoform X2 n=1 Tax=Hydra vulgaris TaxID=6087 RepID=A0ABM4BSJ9_HYDVU